MLGHGRTVLASFSHRTGGLRNAPGQGLLRLLRHPSGAHYALSYSTSSLPTSPVTFLFFHGHEISMSQWPGFHVVSSTPSHHKFLCQVSRFCVPLCRLISRSSSSPTRKCSKCSRILHSFYVIPGSAICIVLRPRKLSHLFDVDILD